MMGQMGENPMFKNMMQGVQDVNNIDKSEDLNKEELSHEEKKRRLREIIKEKQNNR